jgi:hypothetical protein
MHVEPGGDAWQDKDGPGCVRCSIAPPSGQLPLFEFAAVSDRTAEQAVPDSRVLANRDNRGWPRIETSACRRPVFVNIQPLPPCWRSSGAGGYGSQPASRAVGRARKAGRVGAGRRREGLIVLKRKEDLVLDPEPVEELRERVRADV